MLVSERRKLLMGWKGLLAEQADGKNNVSTRIKLIFLCKNPEFLIQLVTQSVLAPLA